jgi:hypothetical protein
MNQGSTFINLLKAHTNIDEDFINIFFSKFRIGDDLEFHINENDIADYLNITVNQIRSRLNNRYRVNYYIKNVDYIKIPTGITQQVIYYVNYSCFEKLAMGCDSVNAFNVKEYFIKLRKFIMKYEDIFQQSIQNYDILNNKLLKKYNIIYFFVVDKKYKNIIKLGTTSNLIERIRTYNTGRINDVDIKYASIVYDGDIIEKCIKNNYIVKQSQQLVNREIYNISADTLIKVISNCYKKHTSKDQHDNMYKDIASILDLYDFITSEKNVEPFVIIPFR